MNTQRTERAILSCFDKTGLVEFAKALQDYGVEIVSTAGTLHALTEAGVKATGISEYTGVREIAPEGTRGAIGNSREEGAPGRDDVFRVSVDRSGGR
jgi:hypothetical protein